MSNGDQKFQGSSPPGRGQFLPYGRQNINQDDIGAVVEVLKSDWLTQGPLLLQFEQAVVEFFGGYHKVQENSRII
jgi:dTDP-4-amino-4,6-dideoxygalactose transaminase